MSDYSPVKVRCGQPVIKRLEQCPRYNETKSTIVHSNKQHDRTEIKGTKDEKRVNTKTGRSKRINERPLRGTTSIRQTTTHLIPTESTSPPQSQPWLYNKQCVRGINMYPHCIVNMVMRKPFVSESSITSRAMNLIYTNRNA